MEIAQTVLMTALLCTCSHDLLSCVSVMQGFISGGKDGVVTLWDKAFENILKKYTLHSSAVGGGRGQMYEDTPPIRALCQGQGQILVGTRNSEILEVGSGGSTQLLVQVGHMTCHMLLSHSCDYHLTGSHGR